MEQKSGIVDILLKGGKVIDPAQGIEKVIDIGIKKDKILAVGNNFKITEKTKIVNCKNLIITPGLIDLHVHVYPKVTPLGLDPDTIMNTSGVTTMLDAGSAGSANWTDFKKNVIIPAKAQVLALPNLCKTGLVFYKKGELLDKRNADSDGTIKIIKEDNRAFGIKIRAGIRQIGEGEEGWSKLRQAIKVARQTNTRIMVHMANTPKPLSDIVKLLNPGDIITHCYKGGDFYNLVCDEKGKLYPVVLEAAERGVIFDVGHGNASFDWNIAEKAIDQGLLANTISSDLHKHSIDKVISLPMVMTKFLILGLSLKEVIKRVTLVPAQILGLDDKIGTLRSGSKADVTMLRWKNEKFNLYDSCGNYRKSEGYLSVTGVIKAGIIIP